MDPFYYSFFVYWHWSCIWLLQISMIWILQAFALNHSLNLLSIQLRSRLKPKKQAILRRLEFTPLRRRVDNGIRFRRQFEDEEELAADIDKIRSSPKVDFSFNLTTTADPQLAALICGSEHMSTFMQINILDINIVESRNVKIWYSCWICRWYFRGLI